MRILLADDQSEVRSALKMLLEHELGLDIIGETAEPVDLIVQTRENKPDLVLLDWELQNIRVADIIPTLREICPKLQIVALSGRPESSAAAKKAGVDAFVSKGDPADKLLDALRKIEKRL